MRGDLRQAGRKGAPPLVLLFAVAFLLSLAGRADAAMVLTDPVPYRSVCSATGDLVDGGCILDAEPVDDPGFALTDLDLIGRGGDLLAGAAASAMRATESITPVPLPAAAWLLAMGLGGLGLIGKRRREALPGLRGEDGVEPLAATLTEFRPDGGRRSSARPGPAGRLPASHRRVPRLLPQRDAPPRVRAGTVESAPPCRRRGNALGRHGQAGTARRRRDQARRRRHSRAGRRARVFRLFSFQRARKSGSPASQRVFFVRSTRRCPDRPSCRCGSRRVRHPTTPRTGRTRISPRVHRCL